MQTIDPAVDVAIDHRVREFLKALNSGGGKPLEEMAPRDARAVLTNLQASVKLDLPPAQVSELSITAERLCFFSSGGRVGIRKLFGLGLGASIGPF